MDNIQQQCHFYTYSKNNVDFIFMINLPSTPPLVLFFNKIFFYCFPKLCRALVFHFIKEEKFVFLFAETKIE